MEVTPSPECAPAYPPGWAGLYVGMTVEALRAARPGLQAGSGRGSSIFTLAGLLPILSPLLCCVGLLLHPAQTGQAFFQLLLIPIV